jgi:hypothetical protein
LTTEAFVTPPLGVAVHFTQLLAARRWGAVVVRAGAGAAAGANVLGAFWVDSAYPELWVYGVHTVPVFMDIGPVTHVIAPLAARTGALIGVVVVVVVTVVTLKTNTLPEASTHSMAGGAGPDGAVVDGGAATGVRLGLCAGGTAGVGGGAAGASLAGPVPTPGLGGLVVAASWTLCAGVTDGGTAVVGGAAGAVGTGGVAGAEVGTVPVVVNVVGTVGAGDQGANGFVPAGPHMVTPGTLGVVSAAVAAPAAAAPGTQAANAPIAVATAAHR